LGLTLACARCHDHKYDPISQKEFYQFFAFFNNLPESGTLAGNQTGGNTDPVEKIESPLQNAESLKIELAIKEQEALILKLDEKVDHMIKEWEPVFKAKVKSTDNIWIPLNPTNVKSEGGAKLANFRMAPILLVVKILPMIFTPLQLMYRKVLFQQFYWNAFQIPPCPIKVWDGFLMGTLCSQKLKRSYLLLH
jgi:hypothetical protein